MFFRRQPKEPPPQEERKVLIANRGECALRILRTCIEQGIPAVVAYSEADKDSLPVKLAPRLGGEIAYLGPAAAKESYLNLDRIIEVALETGCTAIHPGWGFLAENGQLAQRSEEMGIRFIGPLAKTIQGKETVKKLMFAAGLPVLPGSDGPIPSFEEAQQLVRAKGGYPVMIKPSRGGGGIGIRVINSENELREAFGATQALARGAFGADELYIEEYLLNPRHLEVQIAADNFNNVICLGIRDCSLQRNNQKIVEETPPSKISPALYDRLFNLARQGAKATGYRGLGTLEFLVDEKENPYFIEFNMRLQVEHTITEEALRSIGLNLDLVALQIGLAFGEKLPFHQWRITSKPPHHVIECRINAESTGVITRCTLPRGPNVRVDSDLFSGYEVTPHYFPLLAKVITWGENRERALVRMRWALTETTVEGITTNLTLLWGILENRYFLRGETHTGLVKEIISP